MYIETMIRSCFLFLLCIFLAACGGTPEQTSFSSAPLQAAVISDLHYQLPEGAVNTIMPLSAYCDDFMDTLTAQIIDLHPDVPIMTGDKTNN